MAWDHELLSATINGNLWTDYLDGSVTAHVNTSAGALLFSDVVPSKNTRYTLYENGVFNNSQPDTLEPGPERFVCSGNTLRTFAADGSSVYTREVP